MAARKIGPIGSVAARINGVLISTETAKATAYAIEATEYPDLARQYRVTGVPKTIIDERVEILGAVPEEEFVEQTVMAARSAGGAA